VTDLKSAFDQSQGMIDSVRKETKDAVAKILETGDRQAESLKRQMIGAAELQSRNSELVALESAVNDVFNSVMKGLSGLDPVQYEESLVRLLREGIEAIGPSAVVWCRPEDRKTVSSVMKKLNKEEGAKLVLDEEGEDGEARRKRGDEAEGHAHTVGGVVLRTPDGTVRFDNTFEARLERLRPMLRKEIADVLGTK
jgi:V/A-type H+/Na+-transporting ATPase subunit E